jgi:hypothetical protein
MKMLAALTGLMAMANEPSEPVYKITTTHNDFAYEPRGLGKSRKGRNNRKATLGRPKRQTHKGAPRGAYTNRKR